MRSSLSTNGPERPAIDVLTTSNGRPPDGCESLLRFRWPRCWGQREIRGPGGPDGRSRRAPQRAHSLMRKRGAQEATMQMGRMGAEDPLTSAAWSSIHECRHGGRGRGDVAGIRSVIERRNVGGELLGFLDQLGVIVDETRAQVARSKVRVVEDGAVIADRSRRTDHDELAQRASCAGYCLGTIGPM